MLDHHERLDGFGYPRGIAGDAFPLDGQILATAEWMMALIDSGSAPLAKMSVVNKLMPGEFGTPLQEILKGAGPAHEVIDIGDDSAASLQLMLPRLERIVATLQRFREQRTWIQEQIDRAEPALASLLRLGMERMRRIQNAFSSCGLDHGADPQQMIDHLVSHPDPAMHQEVLTMIREFGWRMQELERESLLRAGMLGEADGQLMRTLIERLRAQPISV